MSTSEPLAVLLAPLNSPVDQAESRDMAFTACLPAPKSAQGHRPAQEVKDDPTIMIVDDEPINIKLLRKFLAAEGYKRFVTTTDSRQAIEMIGREQPDVVLLDVMMPHVSGLEILKQLRQDDRFADLPVIVVTAADVPDTKQQALALGATEFLGKPVDFVELLPRVRNSLVVKAHHDHLKNYASELERQVALRTAESTQAQLDAIYCLARASEFRDDDTGRHVIRVGRYAGIIAEELGLGAATARTIQHAAILHDIGKIGIPDAILLKSGPLDAREWEVMQRHSDYGRNICESALDSEWEVYKLHARTGARIVNSAVSPILQMAGVIAASHHENWDGTGYPCGLAGEQIPMEGRITAVADVFDALSSKRPYKPAFPQEKCVRIMKEGRGARFDPAVLDSFFHRLSDIITVQAMLTDAE